MKNDKKYNKWIIKFLKIIYLILFIVNFFKTIYLIILFRNKTIYKFL